MEKMGVHPTVREKGHRSSSRQLSFREFSVSRLTSSALHLFQG